MAMAEDRVPSTGEQSPYMHIFFRMDDGSYVAFFEIPESPPMGRDQNTPAWVQHLALRVPDMKTLMAYKRKLEKLGIEVRRPDRPHHLQVDLLLRPERPPAGARRRHHDAGHEEEARRGERATCSRSGARPRRRPITRTGCTRSDLRRRTRVGAHPVPGNRAIPEVYGFAGSQGLVNLRRHPLRAQGQAVEDARGVHASRDHAAAPAGAAGAGEGRRARAVRRLALRQERHAAHHGEGGARPRRLHPPREGEVGLREDRALRLVGRRLAVALLPGAGARSPS